jgi:uncharacterized repeat protein (TIGR03803 family)
VAHRSISEEPLLWAKKDMDQTTDQSQPALYSSVMQPRATARHGLVQAALVTCLVMLLAACGGSSGDVPITHTVTARVSGLSGFGLVLELNGGNDLAVSVNGNAGFATPVASGANYQVTVRTQPSSPQQVCNVANGSGTVGTGNVTVPVTCVTSSYTVGATVQGLLGTGLVLQLNGGNNLSIAANGTVSFSGAVASGTRYAVAVQTQPVSPAQVCSVTSSSGTVGTGNVTVAVICAATGYTVGGIVQGLSGTGLVLQLNGANDLSITANGTVSFAGAVASGAPYSVAVRTQPTSPAQTCLITRGSGTITTYNIAAVAISCISTPLVTGSPIVSTLYSFTGGVGGSTDASSPNGSLVQGSSDGKLYGTTAGGGMYGTFFKISLAGDETVLYYFGAPLVDDPTRPYSGVIQASDGNFYGTTVGDFGGSYSGGVFRVTPAGAESKLFGVFAVDSGDRFQVGGVIESSAGYLYAIDQYDGRTFGFAINESMMVDPAPTPNLTPWPVDFTGAAALLQAGDGSFYLTTSDGGGNGHGAVFKLTAGTFTPIYSFGGVPGDALSPRVPLIEGGDGNLYGTTATGGSASAACPSGCGTVFKITPSGVETVLYSFGSSDADGQAPSGALVQGIDGNFYGLTSAGGNTLTSGSATPSCNCGTIFRITPSGAETVLYAFGSSAADGARPSGALLQASDGNFYGTTASGGPASAGTVFKLVLGAN